MERSRIASQPTPQRKPSWHINYHSTASPNQPAAPCTSPPPKRHIRSTFEVAFSKMFQDLDFHQGLRTPSLPDQQLSSKLDSTSTVSPRFQRWTAPDDESASCCEPWVTKGSKSHKSTCLMHIKPIQKKVWKSVGIFSTWKSRWEMSPKTHLNHAIFWDDPKLDPKISNHHVVLTPLNL